jgi:aminoglycoside phosphotransferase (APT) family kinase protein
VPGDDEIPLAGGMGSGGNVVRVGATVRRPVRPSSPAVHAFLEHLEAVGFDGAPRYRGIDEQGRAVLTYVDGDVGIPPFPAWTAADGLLRSVADLQRRLHAAARSFAPPPDAAWDTANLPPPGPDAIVCHNDLCVENVVVRDGAAVGFIDFDFAAPSAPLLDIAIAARHWVPFRDPADLDDGRAGVDQVARFVLFADAHGLDRAQRGAVVGLGRDFLDRALVSMRRRAEAGLATYVAAWTGGYADQNRRSKAWLVAHTAELAGSD